MFSSRARNWCTNIFYHHIKSLWLSNYKLLFYLEYPQNLINNGILPTQAFNKWSKADRSSWCILLNLGTCKNNIYTIKMWRYNETWTLSIHTTYCQYLHFINIRHTPNWALKKAFNWTQKLWRYFTAEAVHTLIWPSKWQIKYNKLSSKSSYNNNSYSNSLYTIILWTNITITKFASKILLYYTLHNSLSLQYKQFQVHKSLSFTILSHCWGQQDNTGM